MILDLRAVPPVGPAFEHDRSTTSAGERTAVVLVPLARVLDVREGPSSIVTRSEVHAGSVIDLEVDGGVTTSRSRPTPPPVSAPGRDAG